MKVLAIIVGIAALAGAVWFFTRSSTPVTTTDTKTDTSTNSGLSSIIASTSGILKGLNISLLGGA